MAGAVASAREPACCALDENEQAATTKPAARSDNIERNPTCILFLKKYGLRDANAEDFGGIEGYDNDNRAR
jgi:hypothetical protein